MGNYKYDDPVGLIAGSITLELVAALCVCLRFYARRWQRQAILASDWLILSAFVFGTALAVIEIYAVMAHILGYPAGVGGAIEGSPVTPTISHRLDKAKYIVYAYFLLGIAGAGFVKLSVCFFYWYLFARVKFRRLLIVWITIIIMWTVGFILGSLLECGSHLTAAFSQEGFFQYCRGATTIGYGMVGSDIATDFITLIIPIPLIWRLQTSIHKKVLISLLFMIGALSVSASIAKGYIFIVASTGSYTEDMIVKLTAISIWNLVEVHVGIIAASGPMLPVILVHLLPIDAIFSVFSFTRNNKWKCFFKPPSFVEIP